MFFEFFDKSYYIKFRNNKTKIKALWVKVMEVSSYSNDTRIWKK